MPAPALYEWAGDPRFRNLQEPRVGVMVEYQRGVGGFGRGASRRLISEPGKSTCPPRCIGLPARR